MHCNKLNPKIAKNKVKENLKNKSHAKTIWNQEHSPAKTKFSKNILNHIQTYIQHHKKYNSDECQDYKAQNVKFDTSLKNHKDSKCKPASPRVYHFKLHIPPRGHTSNTAQQRSNSLHFEQNLNEEHIKVKKDFVCNAATIQSKNWKEIEIYKDNIVLHLKTALAALEDDGIGTKTVECDLPEQHVKKGNRNLSQNSKILEMEFEPDGRSVDYAEDACSKNIGFATPCCKGCYSISCTVPSQFYHHPHVEDVFFGDRAMKTKDLHNINDSYLCESRKTSSIFCRNIACLRKHYASHLQHVTATEGCKQHLDNEKQSLPKKSSPCTSSLSSMWRSNTFNSTVTSSSESKSSFQKSSCFTSDCTPNSKMSSKNFATELKEKQACNNQVEQNNQVSKYGENKHKVINNGSSGKMIGLKNESGNCERRNETIVSSKKNQRKTVQPAEKDGFTIHERNGFHDSKKMAELSDASLTSLALLSSRQKRNTRLSSLDKINIEISNLKQELDDIKL